MSALVLMDQGAELCSLSPGETVVGRGKEATLLLSASDFPRSFRNPEPRPDQPCRFRRTLQLASSARHSNCKIHRKPPSETRASVLKFCNSSALVFSLGTGTASATGERNSRHQLPNRTTPAIWLSRPH